MHIIVPPVPPVPLSRQLSSYCASYCAQAAQAERRAVEAEKASERLREALTTRADEVQLLRAQLVSARQPPSGPVGEPAWRGRVRALEQQLAESEERLWQSTQLIEKLRAYVGSS